MLLIVMLVVKSRKTLPFHIGCSGDNWIINTEQSGGTGEAHAGAFPRSSPATAGERMGEGAAGKEG